ncbi:MAG: hypothetical protein U1F35_12210 [Steroidobacteraceae bacterium]
MRSDLRLRPLWLSLGYLMVAFVLAACLLPRVDIQPVASLLWDKAEHAIAFFGLTLWFAGLYVPRLWGRIAASFFTLGVLIEIAQGLFTTTRSADPLDAAADAIGILVALAAARLGARDWSLWTERLLRLGRTRQP